MRKELGKIESVKFGLGGYQDCCIGIHFTLGGKGWGTITGSSAWDANIIECRKDCKWTEKDRSEQYDKIVRYISALLNDAKVNSIDKLINIPIEATFDGMQLVSWRILKEVI